MNLVRNLEFKFKRKNNKDMSLVGDLEFKTIIDDKPAIIKMPNATILNVEVLSEDGLKKAVFTIEKTIKIDAKGESILTIEEGH